jgi:hypothetical protein
MIRLPAGMAMPKFVVVKLQPMPKIRSAFFRKCGTVACTARPPEPSASGWSSGKLDLPPSELVTGAASSSARSRSCGQARAQCTPVPA